VQGPYTFYQIFLTLFLKIIRRLAMKINLFDKELMLLFEADGKGKGILFTGKLLYSNLSTFTLFYVNQISTLIV
jgi:hypothetical protein